MLLNMRSQTDVQVQRIRAIALTVTSCNRSLDFYTQALGFELVSDITVEGQDYSDLQGITEAKIRIITLRLGDELIELMEYLNIQGKPIPTDSQSNDIWFQHLAIVVSDMDRAYAQLCSFPIGPISVAPQTILPDNQTSGGVRAFKFKDPDGHDLELIWFPPHQGQDKWHQNTNRLFLGIDHTAMSTTGYAYAISNTEQSLHFYRDLLGMQIDSRSLNWRATQARLDNLPGAEVKITGLRPVQGGLGIELLDYLVPGKGRPMPSDWKSCDIAHIQIELVVNNIEQAVEILRQNGVQFVSSRIVQFPVSGSCDRKGCLVKDPDGHAILLVTST
ncbi:VOC family protein [Nostoc punctiforme]|jgi:catechol 2,3-dioxygenase-like lactoylglutathione lyase family enzyme|uniref:Glyoxalase/bleomycin resistance protein/dioxygenase n=1 Tax=Nostoc punctiforme (strain ATCC 29133 / PCC 73102) TaxID=63737 RepID=B2J2L5_NOSP7|nr:VOC family protein [Nostoc punctiforme]ACC80446.1 Glyoxalase/bleomycin resistance protein/dioxygenase [Nostoc punctiforme PCC 73102]